MKTTVRYSLNIIVSKNTWELVPGNPIHWVIIISNSYRPQPAAYLWYNCERFAPRSHFKSRFDHILIKNYHALCSL